MRIAEKAFLFIEEIIPAVLLAAMCILISVDVAGRYIFNSPLRGAAEISLIMVVWLVFLAGAAITRRGMHIAIDSLYVELPARVRFFLDILSEILMIAVFVIIAYNTVILLLTGTYIVLPATGMPKQLVVMAIPVGASLIVLHSVQRIGHTSYLYLHDRGQYVRPSEPFDDEAFSDLDTREISQIQAAVERNLPQ